jgi:hypothetical protein
MQQFFNEPLSHAAADDFNTDHAPGEEGLRERQDETHNSSFKLMNGDLTVSDALKGPI